MGKFDPNIHSSSRPSLPYNIRTYKLGVGGQMVDG